MIIKNKTGFYQIQELLVPGIIHGFSTKKFGNMSFKFGNEEEVSKNQENFLSVLGALEKVAQPRLTHNTKIKIVNTPGVYPEFDGLITNKAGLPLLITTADCAPILFYDPVKKVVGLVHSGWMGAVGKISVITIGKMTSEFKSQPKDILVGFGPSLEKCCYLENGPAMQEVLPEWKDYINIEGNARRYDLNGFMINQLLEIGIKKENIFHNSFCTKDHSDEFNCSQLETAGIDEPGRFASVIELV